MIDTDRVASVTLLKINIRIYELGGTLRLLNATRRSCAASARLPPNTRSTVTNHSYGIVDIVGTSDTTVDAAIRGAIADVAASHRDLDWFEVRSIRGHLENGAVEHMQVELRVGYRL